MFCGLQLDQQSSSEGRQANLERIQESIEDFFQHTNQSWNPQDSGDAPLLELVVKETISIALKSSKASDYIEQLMTLEEETQEFLQTIVEVCLGSLEEGGNARVSNNSEENSERGSNPFKF